MTIRWTIRISLLLITGVILINACKKSAEDKGPHPLTFTVPPGFPSPTYTFTTNQLTEEGFQLGRKLFYDGRLSQDGLEPCASCHQQFAAFGTYDHDLAHGFNNQHTLRNAPALFNMVWHKQWHWDGAILNLEVQPLAPLQAPNEMAEEINHVLGKLQADSAYRVMFKAAFGDEQVTSQRFLWAITQFVGSMVSANSRYDKVKAGQATFSSDEQNGYAVYQAKCSTCHAEPLFTDLSFRNNGLKLDPFLLDYGKMRITGKKEDSLKFKVPSLRNLYFSFPYMHDGRFVGISQVLEHYNSGIQDGPTLDPLLKNKIPLNNVEKYYLTQFLRALTDSTFVNDKRFGPPQ